MLITTAVVTPAQAMTDATDRSKSPEARQNNMPQATMPDIEIARPSPFILMNVAKLGTKIAQAINNTANTTSIPYWSQIRPRVSDDFDFGAPDVVKADINSPVSGDSLADFWHGKAERVLFAGLVMQ